MPRSRARPSPFSARRRHSVWQRLRLHRQLLPQPHALRIATHFVDMTNLDLVNQPSNNTPMSPWPSLNRRQSNPRHQRYRGHCRQDRAAWNSLVVDKLLPPPICSNRCAGSGHRHPEPDEIHQRSLDLGGRCRRSVPSISCQEHLFSVYKDHGRLRVHRFLAECPRGADVGRPCRTAMRDGCRTGRAGCSSIRAVTKVHFSGSDFPPSLRAGAPTDETASAMISFELAADSNPRGGHGFFRQLHDPMELAVSPGLRHQLCFNIRQDEPSGNSEATDCPRITAGLFAVRGPGRVEYLQALAEGPISRSPWKPERETISSRPTFWPHSVRVRGGGHRRFGAEAKMAARDGAACRRFRSIGMGRFSTMGEGTDVI